MFLVLGMEPRGSHRFSTNEPYPQLQTQGFFRTELVWGGVRSRISGKIGVSIARNDSNS